MYNYILYTKLALHTYTCHQIIYNRSRVGNHQHLKKQMINSKILIVYFLRNRLKTLCIHV